ncbi:hypothetical protein PMAYCL1PPCAC_13878, partial [Pristionchus mayeri]
ADLFYWALNEGRDQGFQHCVGTYWVTDTFIWPKLKPILGLGLFHLAFLAFLAYNWILYKMIRKVESSRGKPGHSKRFIPHEHKHFVMFWSQLSIFFVCLIFPRLFLITIPFFQDCLRG